MKLLKGKLAISILLSGLLFVSFASADSKSKAQMEKEERIQNEKEYQKTMQQNLYNQSKELADKSRREADKAREELAKTTERVRINLAKKGRIEDLKAPNGVRDMTQDELENLYKTEPNIYKDYLDNTYFSYSNFIRYGMPIKYIDPNSKDFDIRSIKGLVRAIGAKNIIESDLIKSKPDLYKKYKRKYKELYTYLEENKSLIKKAIKRYREEYDDEDHINRLKKDYPNSRTLKEFF